MSAEELVIFGTQISFNFYDKTDPAFWRGKNISLTMFDIYKP